MESIPKFFWYVISVCVLSITTVVVVLALKSNNFTVKYADIEVCIAKEKAQVISDNIEILRMKNELKKALADLKIRESEINDKQKSFSFFPDSNQSQAYVLPNIVPQLPSPTPENPSESLGEVMPPFVVEPKPNFNFSESSLDPGSLDKIEARLSKINPTLDFSK